MAKEVLEKNNKYKNSSKKVRVILKIKVKNRELSKSPI